jgi:tRNA A37 threonylcarbamoyladenosine synthetase subunit TsaC/SUA5/YrdC
MQLAESVEVYLEDGLRGDAEDSQSLPSTIVDCTSQPFRVVREGAIPVDRLREIVPDLLGIGEEPAEMTSDPAETPGESSQL